MSKKTGRVLIINAHPDAESFNHGLAQAYKAGAGRAGAQVEELVLRELQFDPNLRFGYRQRCDLEPDLLKAQAMIAAADHLVWVYPVWWGSVPALLKGFLDRTFLPGFAFKPRANSVWWDKLLTGKSARIVCTLDQPAWYYWLIYRSPSHHAMKDTTLKFCGVSPVRITSFGPVKGSSDARRAKWRQQVEKLGERLR